MTPDHAAALADILVVRSDGRPPAELAAELLHRFPGARLVIVIERHETTVPPEDLPGLP